MGALVGHRLHLWRVAKGVARPVVGARGEPPRIPEYAGPGRGGRVWLAPIPRLPDYWLELEGGSADDAATVLPLVGELLERDRDALAVARELAERYEEIELLYTISEILGKTIGLADAAQRIVREVGTVVGARRASILVHDAEADLLRPVAGFGIDVAAFESIAVSDRESVAARAFRERRPVVFDPSSPEESEPPPDRDQPRTYRGRAFLSVPIVYPERDALRPVGVINLTDRTGHDAFTETEVRLVSAIANHIGAAIENARLVERDRDQQRVRREIELAHDLQLKLLRPTFAAGPSVAARALPAESVGGDFYHVVRLGDHRLGVMLGDVSSHGFAAALMMALVLSAAGIHAAEAETPDEALRLLLASVGDELRATEMYVTVFYGMSDPEAQLLRYANAGHPHAFLLDGDGGTRRLGATSPPLGLAEEASLTAAEVPWRRGKDLLVVCSDGVIDARADEAGEPFGENRLLDVVRAHRRESPDAIADAVFAEVERYTPHRRDDRTILVLSA